MRKDRKPWLFGGLVVAVLLVTGLLFFCDPSQCRLFPPCPFHKLTGLYCSGCGSLRALHRLLGGNIVEAFQLNPLMVLFLPFVLYGLLAEAFRYFFSKKIPVASLSSFWVWTILVVIIIYGILRNIPVFPFKYLAP